MSTSQADGDPLIQELEALLDDGLVSDQTLHALHAPPVSPAALAGLMPRYQLRDLVGAGGMGFFNSGLHDPRALDPSAQLDRQFKLEILQTAIDKFHADATASEW
jgi:hypothetical protein